MKGADPGTKPFVVEPGRLLETIKEIAQSTLGEAQNLLVLLYAGCISKSRTAIMIKYDCMLAPWATPAAWITS